jgi:hypothetical protein
MHAAEAMDVAGEMSAAEMSATMRSAMPDRAGESFGQLARAKRQCERGRKTKGESDKFQSSIAHCALLFEMSRFRFDFAIARSKIANLNA